jgi:hypothetical protein
MRRLLLVFAVAVVTAAAVTAAASAKEGGVELSSTPFGLGPGDPWNGELTVYAPEASRADLNPSITIRNLDTGETQTFAAQPAKVPTTREAQVFIFDVVFPSEGRYRYTARDGVTDREYAFPVVRIVESTPMPVPARTASLDESGFPLWPLVGGLGGAMALALAALLALRRGRLAH